MTGILGLVSPNCSSRSAALLLLFLWSLILFKSSEAHQLKLAATATTSLKGVQDSPSRLTIRSIKHSGPSPSGPGHRSTNVPFSRPTRDRSGPSPGIGHGYFRGMHH
ncbi:conserved hypothetical protein [Ricinus communis]|uniref:Uncharacterized protein n=1 Tax=Ricinus communis TaxID=3988 RepID=B9RY89_RICCO|nr:conserved hypothetical protein [Ricinus communis]